MTDTCNGFLSHVLSYGMLRCTNIGLLGKAMLYLIRCRKNYLLGSI